MHKYLFELPILIKIYKNVKNIRMRFIKLFIEVSLKKFLIIVSSIVKSVANANQKFGEKLAFLQCLVISYILNNLYIYLDILNYQEFSKLNHQLNNLKLYLEKIVYIITNFIS